MIIMYNRSVIWISQPINMEFLSVLKTNYHFFVNRRLTLLYFDPKFEIFKPDKNLYT
jgi:hypothetical protein